MFALATTKAIDTPKIAFAPRLLLFFVPSNCKSKVSSSLYDSKLFPTISFFIVVFTFSTAFCTHFPRYLDLSPSLNSSASWIPVEAPDGTIALPKLPSSKVISTSTVGFHLESKTSLAKTFFTVCINKKLKN